MITAALIAIVFGQSELLLTRFSRDPQGRCEIWRYQSGGPARRILAQDIDLNDDYLTMQFQLAVSPSGDRFLQAVGVSSKGPNDVVELRQYNVDGGPLRKDRVELEYAKGALYGWSGSDAAVVQIVDDDSYLVWSTRSETWENAKEAELPPTLRQYLQHHVISQANGVLPLAGGPTWIGGFLASGASPQLGIDRIAVIDERYVWQGYFTSSEFTFVRDGKMAKLARPKGLLWWADLRVCRYPMLAAIALQVELPPFEAISRPVSPTDAVLVNVITGEVRTVLEGAAYCVVVGDRGD